MAFPIAKLSFTRNLGTEVVTVFAGKEKQPFVVHKALLTSACEYFEKALNGKFKEAEEKKIHFDEEDPATIELLIAFLYLGVLPGVPQPSNIPPGLFPTPGTATALSIQAPPKSDGTSVPFRPIDVIEPNTLTQQLLNRFLHICFDRTYDTYSPDELRLADYERHRKYGSAAELTQQYLPPLPPISMAAAMSRRAASHPPTIQGMQFGHPASHIPAGSQATSSSATPDRNDDDHPFASLFTNRPTVTFGTATPLPRNGPAASWFGTHSWGNPSTPPSQTPNNTPVQSPSASAAVENAQGSTSAAGSSTSGEVSGFAKYASDQSGLVQSSLQSTGSVFSHQTSIEELRKAKERELREATFRLHSMVKPSMSPKSSRNSDLRPGDFGYNLYIKYPEPGGNFLKGIPRSENIAPVGAEVLESNQDAFLHLCILAETICWPKLFNAAIDAYTQGERNLRRNIPVEHVDTIYERTHANSSLRNYVLDCMRGLPKGANKEYAALVYAHEDFLEGIMSKLSTDDSDDEASRDRRRPAQKNYHMTIDEDPFVSTHRA
ncbi:hypothetical protein HYFRA_00005975 [Hymenoscyphus fraxineus]|uniref:BTB domain-containing protein n=1 Tax=Hymenoscyphus fraxineus TaxID=746836 RepID=A0A9N9PP84_9HELO|nr:hypothetical protein HYFRA_00005975 [Hymenoscyphus fraxineus]